MPARILQAKTAATRAMTGEGESLISTALSVAKDCTGALQAVPYFGAVAGAAVKVLEIREEVKDNKELFEEVQENVAGRMLRLVETLESQVQSETPAVELSRDLKRYEQ
jgi:predicted ATP-grasp superfamily ATP-dependent carboligase